MHGSLRSKVLLWFAVVVAAVALATWIGYQKLSSQVRSEAETQMEARAEHVLDVLEATNELYSNLVRASLGVLRRDAERLGTPAIREKQDGSGSALFFGDHEIGADFTLVDGVTQLMGGTATIFKRDGDRFVRVSTNVKRPDGSRATGTELDMDGPAIRALLKNQPFFGVVDILGAAYITGYEPIVDAGGSVIGASYVGYALNTLVVVKEAMNSRAILDRGFFALLDPSDSVIFQTSNTPFAKDVDALAMAAAAGQPLPPEWVVQIRVFEPWNYDVVAALYLPDVNRITYSMMAQAYGITGAVLLGLLVASFWLASRLSTALEEAERSRAEAVEAQNAAESANRTKSTFLANMSHELRTPMNAIIGYSEMLIEEAEDLDQREFIPDLNKIRGAGKHLLALINDILDVSKIEAGKMSIFIEEIDLRPMIDDVVSTIQPLLDKNNNRLIVEAPAEIGTMRADLTKVRQTLFNLLSNASKFTENGTVTLAVERRETEAGERIFLRVADTGIGMTADQLGKLFQAFTQADASTTRKYGGTGLGLVISRKFCQLMGGDITVASTPGQGTIFTVDLPSIVRESAPESPTPAANAVEAEKGRRILVIDDDPDAADLMRRNLVKAGFQVLIAGNGALGLQLARSEKPDAITLDVMMPGMDGWSVLTSLKADPVTAHIPVVMVTMLQDKQMGFALGANDFLTKPIDSGKLRQALARHVQGTEAQILVVEDDPANREMLVRILNKEGFGVIEAENGSRALEELALATPQLILLDLMMPVMDGFEFLKVLRDKPGLNTIPVIVVTARDLSDSDRARLTGSVHEVIQKGAMDREKLLNEVAAMLSKTPQSH